MITLAPSELAETIQLYILVFIIHLPCGIISYGAFFGWLYTPGRGFILNIIKTIFALGAGIAGFLGGPLGLMGVWLITNQMKKGLKYKWRN